MLARLYVRFLDILTNGRYSQLVKRELLAKPLVDYLKVVIQHEPNRPTLLAYRKVLVCWDALDE